MTNWLFFMKRLKSNKTHWPRGNSNTESEPKTWDSWTSLKTTWKDKSSWWLRSRDSLRTWRGQCGTWMNTCWMRGRKWKLWAKSWRTLWMNTDTTYCKAWTWTRMKWFRRSRRSRRDSFQRLKKWWRRMWSSLKRRSSMESCPIY